MNSRTGISGIGRYEFQDRLEDRQELLQHQVGSWRGLDRVLERPVLLRVVAGELRGPAGLAARRAATVEDQRLTRVLDIMEDVDVALAAPGTPTTVIVSEWAEGRTLPQYLQANGHQGLTLDRALAIMDAITSALVAAAARGSHHDRLTADHVLIAPDDSVRVRGLSIDAVLFGQWPPGAPASGASADVEALAHLLYLLVTGVSIQDSQPSAAAPTGQSALVFDPPSWVNPGVPKQIDAVVTEILDGSYRSRWSRPDVQGFRAALGLTGPTSRRRTDPGWHQVPMTGRRALGVLAAVAVVGLIFTVGAVLFTLGAPILQPRDAEVTTLLNSPVVLPTQPAEVSPDRVLAVERVRSYDPYDDDNADGKPDGRKGRENNKSASNAADGNTTTRWNSNTYRTADADGKGGVGLVLELAVPSTVQAVDLDFGSVGSAVEVKVGDDIWPDPMLWTDFANAPAGEGQITIRGPRAVKGKYVLLWFPELPPTPEDPERFQGRLAEVSVRGE